MLEFIGSARFMANSLSNFVEKFIELNVNLNTMRKNLKHVELSINIATVFLNKQILKII